MNDNPEQPAAETNLDRLNKLLRSPELDLPDYRRVVDGSLRNIQWLRKALRATQNVELKALLELPSNKLLSS